MGTKLAVQYTFIQGPQKNKGKIIFSTPLTQQVSNLLVHTH